MNNINHHSDSLLKEEFWNEQYIKQSTGWDLGEISPPLKEYIDQLPKKDIRILIPGCGNSHEADYLLSQGFSNVTVIDISSKLIEKLNNKYTSNNNIKIIQGDFFEHIGEYDLILEQTFFCAIHPSLRNKYAAKMNDLLAQNGKLTGLLFNRDFEKKGPPFGGNEIEYKLLLEKYFHFKHFDKCNNSFFKRKDTEIFICLIKK